MIFDKIQRFIQREVEQRGSKEKEFYFFITEEDLLEVIVLCKQQGFDSQFNKEEKYYVIWYYNKVVKLRILKNLEELVKLQKCVQDSLSLTEGVHITKME